MLNTNNKTMTATIFAILAACFYAINVPFSKIMMNIVPPMYMASFLYLGAGVGIGIMYLFTYKKELPSDRLSKKDIPYTIAMIVLDILAPMLLMLGINIGTASNASLLGNFEIVATTIIALLIFKEKVSKKLWLAIVLITVSSIILSFEGNESFDFSFGSLFVILATVCWGFENNCTKRISNKSIYEIVTLKGIFSGGFSFLMVYISGEQLPEFKYILSSMVLGFVAYGLSIFMYIRAQRDLGAAKTSAYYAIAPFIGAGLSFMLIGNKFTFSYLIALIIMTFGTMFVVSDTFSS